MDRWWAGLRSDDARAAPHLVVALFHVLHRTRGDSRTRALAPNQEVTIDDLKRFLDAMLRAGYSVVSSGDLLGQRTHAPGKLLMLTFDDGYYNNTWALPVLEEFRAPATFFISTGHVLARKAFWWDVVSRRLAGSGRSRAQVQRAVESLKTEPVHRLERRLQLELGAGALKPAGDFDRPFEPDELRDFSRSRWVTLGNHTAQHTILTACPAAEAAREIRRGRDQLKEITGIGCHAIAYPNGNFSGAVVKAAQAAGHQLGFTCWPKANALPVEARAMLTLGRQLIWGGADYDALVPQLAARCLPGASIRAAARRFA